MTLAVLYSSCGTVVVQFVLLHLPQKEYALSVVENYVLNQLRELVKNSHQSISHLSVSSLPPSTTLSHTAASQSLVMSPGGVASDSSVTLTLADAQGMLDGVTLNLNAQVNKKNTQ